MEIERDWLKVAGLFDWIYLKLNRDNANKINILLLKIYTKIIIRKIKLSINYAWLSV